ncbi:hypothetical protein GCM10027570_13270 [Streptomonospora sediminis]
MPASEHPQGPAYCISELIEVLDQAGVERYLDLANPSIVHYGGRVVVNATEPAVPEGDWDGRVVAVVEFPSMDRLTAWYDSPEYAPALAEARTALRRRLLFVQGADTADRT